MRQSIVKKYDQRVARYTSYPTAPHFHDGVDGEVYGRWLSEISFETPLSLYLHIPFCDALCWYCGCQATVVNRYGPVAGYLGHLRQEVDLVVAKLGTGRPVGNIHWGGGTPNTLSPEDIVELAAFTKARFEVSPRVEFSAEIDPRILKNDQIEAFAKAGVTRISFGVQDFDEQVQIAINRIQPYEKTKQAVDGFRAAGIDALNFDLLYGLPHQTRETIIRTVDLAMNLAPNRIALFGYAHVPWMRKHQELIPEESLPGAEERLAMAQVAAERIVGHGMVAIGLDHFARPDDDLAIAQQQGKLRRNFQGYTVDDAPALVGMGSSSIGSLPQGYVQNAHEVKDWRTAIEAGLLPVVRGFELSDEDRLRRSVIERLMCDLAVDLEEICRNYGRSPSHFDDALEALKPMAEDGLVEIEGRRVTVPESARPWVRIPSSVFDQYFSPGTDGGQRHARAV